MDLASIIALGLKLSIVLVVVSLGLGVTLSRLTYLFDRPGLFARMILSLFVIMPVAVIALVSVFPLDPAIRIAMVALAVSPVPPLLPRKSGQAGGRTSLTIDVLAVAAVLSVVFIPLAIGMIGLITGRPTQVSTAAIVQSVLMTVIGPLAVGMIVRALAPQFAERVAGPLGNAALLLLVICVLPVVIRLWPQVWALVGNGAVLAFALFTALGLAIGHLLGGPSPKDRTVLALSTSSRHPGIAMTIAIANAEADTPIVAAMILYLLVGAVVSGVYVAWRRREGEHAAQTRT